jgi:hypothetical protein
VARSQLLVAADRLLRVAGGELEVEVVEPVVAQEVEDELQQRADLALHLLFGAVDVRVVLGEAAGAGEAVDHPGLLVAVDVPNSNSRSGSSRYDRPRDRKIRLCIGQFIGLR